MFVKTNFESERKFIYWNLFLLFLLSTSNFQLNSYLSDVDKSKGCGLPPYFRQLSHPLVLRLDSYFSAASVHFFGVRTVRI